VKSNPLKGKGSFFPFKNIIGALHLFSSLFFLIATNIIAAITAFSEVECAY
jgi:hypothetical protein